MRKGAISVIISTSALEAGIDIAELDAVMLYSFPGTVERRKRRRQGRENERELSLISYVL